MIVFVHLLNDRSGSPRVLCSAISELANIHNGSRLFVGSDGSGCLDDAGIAITRYWYRHTPYRLLTLFTYLISQISLLVRLLRSRDIDRHAVIYINTLLPFGAAIYGLMTRRSVIYHLHEVSVSPTPLRWFLTTIARYTARRLIYVSSFHRNCLPIPSVPSRTIYNSLDRAFLTLAGASSYEHRREACFNVLMVASLRDFKGVPEFLALARRFLARQDIHFHLVLNEEDPAIQSYFKGIFAESNVTVYSRTDNPAVYYAKASLVLNLSRPDLWIETFGLTLLEAMAFGIPVIAPPVGGPLELVSEGNEGFLIDCRSLNELADKVSQLADDEALCLSLSARAREKASHFSPQAFGQALRESLNLQEAKKSKV